jgi:hypothetical protein
MEAFEGTKLDVTVGVKAEVSTESKAV